MLRKQALEPVFWLLAPECLPGEQPFYTLFLQLADQVPYATDQLKRLAQSVDGGLQESYHYHYARRLGQLGACRLFLIAPHSDAFHDYLSGCVAQGQRLGDIKTVALHAYQSWSRRFTGTFIE